MKAIFINAQEAEIKEIELENPDSSSELQDLIGGWLCCGWTWYDAAGFPKNVLYVDDEGLLKDYGHTFRITNADQLGFCNPNGPTVLFGNGVILGVNREGESVDTTIEADDVEVLIVTGER